VRVLLDTHSFLWLIAGDKKLSDAARERTAELDNHVWIASSS
jgi:PIN domain nuclease of toxin-antitoxin system